MCVSYLLYRRSSKLPPGPPGLPFLGNLPALFVSKRDMHDVFTSWSKQYGPVFSVRLGSLTAVVLNDFQSMKKALAHPNLQDRPFLDYMLAVPGEGLATASGRVWFHQRKFAVNIFRNFGIGRASFEDTLRGEAAHLVEAIKGREGGSFDPEYLINNAIANVICLVIHGRRFDYNDVNFQQILQAFKRNMELGLITGISTMIPLLKYFPLGAVKEILKNVKVIEKFTKDLTDGHKPKLEEDDNVKDFTDAFLVEMKNAKKKDMEDVFNDQNLLWVIGDLFAAGTETNTNTIRHALMYLLHNPAVKRKLQNELDSVVGRDKMPRISDRPNLPYTEAFIAECLRKTLSTITLAHTASKSVEIFGFTIPKGAMIVPNLNSIMTDENIMVET
ncbi:putative cytochrome P450 2J6 [Apostichopus japonicus]|uniref:Putative cytochrome P450 2J6 n=1 Tax=Stichopus japonicus TaxID=307972 RepID=A0A2G8JB42_STIJA|nr:putative cytochrome P450 2J6 [Apostichopus japonicus]